MGANASATGQGFLCEPVTDRCEAKEEATFLSEAVLERERHGAGPEDCSRQISRSDAENMLWEESQELTVAAKHVDAWSCQMEASTCSDGPIATLTSTSLASSSEFTLEPLSEKGPFLPCRLDQQVQDSQEPSLVDERYVLEGQIGKGVSCIVKKAWARSTSLPCAVKTIAKETTQRKDVPFVQVQQEIYWLKRLDHPHIIRLHDVFETQSEVHLVTDFCEGGELSQMAEPLSGKVSLAEKAVAKVVKQILYAISYMHHHHICHRDIKLSNCLIAGGGDLSDGCVKVVDLGLACLCPPGKKLRSRVGTLPFLAPEVLARRYDERVDVWSLGVSTFILLTGHLPFYGSTNAEIVQKVKNFEFSSVSRRLALRSVQARGLLQQLIEPDPERRICPQEALGHFWFAPTVSSQEEHIPCDVHAKLTRFSQLPINCKTAMATMASFADEALPEVKRARDMFLALDGDCDGLVVVKPSSSCQTDVLGSSAVQDTVGPFSYLEFLAAVTTWSALNLPDVAMATSRKLGIDETSLKCLLDSGSGFSSI
mmetsp:Transcript_20215/g.36651  ORF Transcript_20215/g.36651 Transcript_20215/m.36651 type:complete len:540 (+) Transcript_20215:37-1656(+)